MCVTTHTLCRHAPAAPRQREGSEPSSATGSQRPSGRTPGSSRTHTHTHRAASAPPGDGGGVRGHPYITRAALTCGSGTKAHTEIGHRLENMLIHPPNAASKIEKKTQGGSRLACLCFSDGKQVKLQLSLTGPVWRCTSLFFPVTYSH